MSKSMRVLAIFLVFMLETQANEVVYGELFLVEEVELSKNQVNLKGAVELDNSIEDVHGVELEYARNLNTYFSLKLSSALYNSSKNDFAHALGETSLFPASPKQSIFGKIRFAPLFGHINFMSMYSLPIELGFNIGYGKYFFDGDEKATSGSGNAYLISLDTQIQITKKYGILLEIENLSRSQRADFDTTVNNFKLGLSYRW